MILNVRNVIKTPVARTMQSYMSIPIMDKNKGIIEGHYRVSFDHPFATLKHEYVTIDDILSYEFDATSVLPKPANPLKLDPQFRNNFDCT